MALAIDNKTNGLTHSQFYVICDIDFDSSYPENGESLTAAMVGLQKIDFCVIPPNSGYVFEYDYTNSKVKAYWADNDGAADSALVEVTATTDLAAVTNVKAIFFGH